MKQSFLDYFQDMMDVNLEPTKATIRVNTLKIDAKELVKRLSSKGFELKKLTYLEDAYEVNYKPFPLGKTLEHVLGYFYIQGAASMLPPTILSPKKHAAVLDMAAAPGGKTILMANLMENTGIIVANDVELPRVKILQTNIQRCGVRNTIVTRLNGVSFGNKQQKYDYILLDAPCSATGTLRNNPHVADMWSQSTAYKLSKLQFKLFEAAYNCLERNGTIVYSTCSLSVEENEMVIDRIIKGTELKAVPIKLDVKSHAAIADKLDDSIKNCIRIYPQDNDTEGFFIAKLRRLE